MKKFATMAICFVLIACMVAGGSLAYLTDRDSEANVFTVGDVRIELSEDFAQGAKLTPGVNIEKTPTIKNTGINDAYVWMDWAVPAALDNAAASANVIHYNYLSYTDEIETDKVTDKNVTDGIAAGFFPAGTTAQDIKDGAYWIYNDHQKVRDEVINGVDYKVYTYLYNKALAPDETTLAGIWNVYLNKHSRYLLK